MLTYSSIQDERGRPTNHRNKNMHNTLAQDKFIDNYILFCIFLPLHGPPSGPVVPSIHLQSCRLVLAEVTVVECVGHQLHLSDPELSLYVPTGQA